MDGFQRGVAAQGFAVRRLPSPLYLRCHVGALVSSADGRDRLDPTLREVPVLGLAVAPQWTDVLRDLAEDAASLRYLRHGSPALSTGAGPETDTAIVRAVYRALARRRAGAGVRSGVAVKGWEPASVLRGVGGRLDCYLLGEEAGVPAIGAVLELDRLAEPFHAVVCDLSPRRGIDRAVAAVLRKFVLASLLRSPDTAAPAGDPPVTSVVEYRELAADAPEDERAELARRLRAHGLTARFRTVGEDAGVVVAECRITPEPGPAVEPGPWGEPDVAAMDLRAPRELSLRYDRDRVRAGRAYHENSKMRAGYGTLPMVDIATMATPGRALIGQAYRDFRHTRREYPVPAAAAELDVLPLEECLRRRRSWAALSGQELTLEQLGRVLTLSYGTTGAARVGTVRLPLRATPSAGGLYSTDLFVLIGRVAGVEPGLYYFHPGKEALQLADDRTALAEAAAMTGYADRAGSCAAMVIYVGAFRRNQWKYWERGYRTVLLDCGHLAQAVVTASTALDLVAHPMVAFRDDYFNELVGVSGTDDAVLYLTLLGPRPREVTA